MVEWISVKDRLPEPLESVLCYHNDGKQSVSLYHDLYSSWMIPYKNMAGITHWMPLHEPPKEDEHGLV